ncbi:hypothetical protein HZC35_04270 [Candidatus Saganbacteria bacterium]|nr:hypothetical protein [Candidatus Saganbacteria bacterium]
MIDPVANNLGALAAQSPVTRSSAAGEFTKIFYRELLRQAFKDQLPPAAEDVMLDKLAAELARKNAGIIP